MPGAMSLAEFHDCWRAEISMFTVALGAFLQIAFKVVPDIASALQLSSIVWSISSVIVANLSDVMFCAMFLASGEDHV